MDLTEVIALARDYNVIPVVRRLFSGTETPLGIYQKLCGDRPGTFLLESAEQGVWGRYSFVGVGSRGSLMATENAEWVSQEVPLPTGQLAAEPIEALRQMQEAWKSAPIDFPLSSGLVGFISWGLVGLLESLPAAKPASYDIPLYGFNQFSSLVVLDHQKSELILVSVLFVDGGDLEAKFGAAQQELDTLEAEIAKPSAAILSKPNWPDPVFDSETDPADFIAKVEAAKEYVRIGDVFQVVISQRFVQEIQANVLSVYRALRAVNPSPYMYLTRWEDDGGQFAIVGSSPEALVKVSNGVAVTHPIAGSRPRGESAAADIELANELINDEKEKSEHLMLVDLARNDLLKVCEPDSLQVSEFMQIHRFSHIMHLVSTVEGKLRGGTGPVDAMLATFPAGTLSGAPKPRALEIIQELEDRYRGLFGGVVGYFDFQGNSDLAIAIRTALVRQDRAYIQAGAGIVLDSIPQSEFEETKAKAAVVLRSVAAANAMDHDA